MSLALLKWMRLTIEPKNVQKKNLVDLNYWCRSIYTNTYVVICVWCVSNQKTKSKPRSCTATVFLFLFNRFADYSLLSSLGRYWEN